MKGKLLRTISIISVIAIILSLFTGCGQEKAKTDAKVKQPKEVKYDLKGQTFTISTYWGTGEPQKTDADYADRMDLKNKLERKYNCQIKFINGGSDYDTYQANYITGVLAGSPMSNIARFCSETIWPVLVLKNAVLPLDDYFDFTTAHGWNSTAAKLGYYKGKHYMTWYESDKPGPFSWGIFFNKTIFEKNSLPNLYELARNKQWTWDKFLEIAKKATMDTNGDGKIDQWGYACSGGSSMGLNAVAGNGSNVTRFDSSGKEYFNLDDPAAIEALQFSYDLLHVYKVVDPDSIASADKDFMAGKVAMCESGTWNTPPYKSTMTDKYGFVPDPIGPRMKDYVSWVCDYDVFVIPPSLQYPALSAEIAKQWLGPHKWDPDPMVIAETWFQDSESVEMSIIGGKAPAPLCDFLSYRAIWNNVLLGYSSFITGDKSASAWVESIKPACQKSIDDVWASAK